MKDWNVIVTVTDRFAYRPFHNVLVMHVSEVGTLLAALAEMAREDMSLFNDISRLLPAQVTFDFETKEEFESKASAALLDLSLIHISEPTRPY